MTASRDFTGDLNDADLERYARHAILDEVGEEGQALLLTKKVCIIGAGGLGSPILLYLSASGIGTLGIVDFDHVDRSNLQRQIAHGEETIGQSKVHSAITQARALNSDLYYKAHEIALTAETAETVLGPYDLIIDGCDNFETRQTVNAVCHRLQKPLVSGSVVRFEGQIASFKSYENGPCYHCLFDHDLGAAAPRCDTAGILGPVAGVIGTLLAVEAIKVLLNMEGSLVGRMLMFDALDPSMRVYKTQKKPDCPICSAN